MSDAWRVASIESFEQVPVAPATVLLRVAAVSAFRALGEDERPTLVADTGDEVLRFASIPAPADEGGLLRCAFSVPAATVAAETAFSLEFEDGHVVALPGPTAGAARPRHEQPAALVGEPPAASEERRSELAPKLTELSEELANARREAGDLRDDAEVGRRARSRILHLHLDAVEARAEQQALRELATLETAELSAARAEHHELRERFAELETWTVELERRLADTTTQLADERIARSSSPSTTPSPLPTHASSIEPEPARGTPDEAQLAEIGRAAAAEAHRTAERDLADVNSSAGS